MHYRTKCIVTYDIPNQENTSDSDQHYDYEFCKSKAVIFKTNCTTSLFYHLYLLSRNLSLHPFVFRLWTPF